MAQKDIVEARLKALEEKIAVLENKGTPSKKAKSKKAVKESN